MNRNLFFRYELTHFSGMKNEMTFFKMFCSNNVNKQDYVYSNKYDIQSCGYQGN